MDRLFPMVPLFLFALLINEKRKGTTTTRHVHLEEKIVALLHHTTRLEKTIFLFLLRHDTVSLTPFLDGLQLPADPLKLSVAPVRLQTLLQRWPKDIM